MQKTLIEWTRTYLPDGSFISGWSCNPLKAINKTTGKRGWACVHAGRDCTGCYAEARNRYVGTGLRFGKKQLAEVDIILDQKELAALSSAKGGKGFICDMTDLFGVWVPDSYIDAIMDRLEANTAITPMLLTKRTDRMCAYLTRRWGSTPPSHIWVGGSAGYQKVYDERRVGLEATPAAVRYWSLEPLIGPIDLSSRWDWSNVRDRGELRHRPPVDWIIAGGESGGSARPPHPRWFETIRDHCIDAQVPFFFKQWGSFAPWTQLITRELSMESRRRYFVSHAGDAVRRVEMTDRRAEQLEDVFEMVRVSKKEAGRILDGRTWDQFPAA